MCYSQCVRMLMYIFTTILGLFVVVSIAVDYVKMGKYCLLHGEITGSLLFHKPVKDFNCIFIMSYHAVGSIFYGIIMTAIFAYFTTRAIQNRPVSLGLCTSIIHMNVDVVSMCLAIATAIMISVGFAQFCNQVTAHSVIKSCKAIEGIIWPKSMDGSTFYTDWMLAQVSAWILVLIWIISVVMQAIDLAKFSQRITYIERTLPTEGRTVTTTRTQKVIA